MSSIFITIFKFSVRIGEVKLCEKRATSIEDILSHTCIYKRVWQDRDKTLCMWIGSHGICLTYLAFVHLNFLSSGKRFTKDPQSFGPSLHILYSSGQCNLPGPKLWFIIWISFHGNMLPLNLLLWWLPVDFSILKGILKSNWRTTI